MDNLSITGNRGEAGSRNEWTAGQCEVREESRVQELNGQLVNISQVTGEV